VRGRFDAVWQGIACDLDCNLSALARFIRVIVERLQSRWAASV